MQLEDKSKELKQEAFLLKEQGSLLNGLQKDIISKQNEIHKQDAQIQKLEADKVKKLKQAGTEFEKELNLLEAEV